MRKKTIFIIGIISAIGIVALCPIKALTIDNTIIEQQYSDKNSYEHELSVKVDEYLRKNLDNEYPSYFGGMYISDDSSKLVIQVVDQSKKVKKSTSSVNQQKLAVDTLSNMDETIQIEYVDNNYNELEEVNNKIIAYFSNNKPDNLVGNYIDVYENLVIVELKDNSKEKQDEFKMKVVNSNLIKFVESSENIPTATTLKAGQGIPSELINNLCSVGYRAKIDGKEGYVTAGHCVKEEGSKIDTGTAIRREYGGNIDAAFIQVNSKYTVSNDLRYYSSPVFSIHTVGASTKITVGMAVAKSGGTTHYTSGKVIGTNYSANESGTYLTNMVITNVKVEGGDSGAPVYIPGKNGGTVLGIASGRKKSDSNSMFFTLESNIFGKFKYTGY